ncbi:MAG: hypothetical protein RBT63_04980, partial [Bdellovibrionales bacterium]|nr:hypothetical protein [Bdellovibrionales bacterium]
MEKISGILPSSSRAKPVDPKEASPVRPGTPSFGRPEGVSSLRKAKIGETANRAATLASERDSLRGVGSRLGGSGSEAVAWKDAAWKDKDAQNAEMARELSNRFFISPSVSENVSSPAIEASGGHAETAAFESELAQ